MRNFRTNNFFKKKLRNTLLLITILCFSVIILFAQNNTKSSSLSKSNENQITSSSNESYLFQGTELALNITDYGNLYKSNQEVILNNQEEVNLTYFLDDTHDWQISKAQLDVKNIEDTSMWVNNSDFLPIEVYRVNETHTDGPGQYLNNRGRTQTLDPINGPSGAIAMRVHFVLLSFEEDYDYFFIEDQDIVVFYTDTGYKTDFFSPWIRGDTLNCYFQSDGSIVADGYEIDYYEFVNSSSNYEINSNDWGFNSTTTTNTNYGSGKIDGSDSMFVALNSELSADGNYWDAIYYENDYSEIYQNFSIPRGSIIDGYISFDYYAQYAMNSNENEIYLKVNNHKIYSKGLGDIVDSGRNQWHHTGKIYKPLWFNTTNVFDGILNEQDFNISVGIKSGASITYSGFADQFQQVFWFDNITLVLTAVANSSQNDIDLKFNGYSPNISDNWGFSELNITNNWILNPVVISVTTNSTHLEFDLDTTLYGFHETTSRLGQTTNQGVNYEILENGTILWEFTHNFYMPAQYSDFEFTITKPRNWNFISALDPTLQSRSYEYGDEGDTILQINKENALYPGWWIFKATSPNFLNISNTKVIGGNSFKTGESTQIKSQINYSNYIPTNLGTTSVNLTIYDPDGLEWFSEVKTPLSNGTIFFSQLHFDALNTTGGEYLYSLFWSNGTSLGGLNSSFFVIHESSFSLLKPNDAISDLITDAFVGDIIPIRIKFFDLENNHSISNAIISYNWTSGTVNFEEAALGIYETILDTSDLASNGFYEILIQSSKVGFENYNLTLKINLGEETTLQRLESDYNIEMHANSTIIFKYYSRISGEGIDGAHVELNITNPALYFIKNTAGGFYTIEFNTSFIYNLGIHELNFNFTAPSYEPQTHIYQFRIVEQSINITSYINNQNINENSIIEVNYMEQLNVSAKAKATIDNEFLSGGNFTWIIGSYQQSLNEDGNFWYNASVMINPSTYSEGLNLVKIKFEMIKYETEIFYFQLLVHKQPVELSVLINSQAISENEIVETMYMENFTVSVHAFATLEMNYVTGAIITWQGGNQDQALIEASSWYNLTIQVVPSNYTAGLNSIAIQFMKNNYQTEVFSFQLLVHEQSVELSAYINSQMISENEIIETMYMEVINVSVRAFATVETEYITGAIITWQGGNQDQALIEASSWYNLSIQIVPVNYPSGLNSITIQFIKDDYQTEVFSFQLLVQKQSIELSSYSNSKEISDNELVEVMFKQTVTFSLRAYGTVDLNYISGAQVHWDSQFYYKDFVEYGGNWYNLSITFSASNFTSGINSVSIKFEKENYTTFYFSFQLLLTEQLVDINASINGQPISEGDLFEAMFKENITISAQAYATGEEIYLAGGNMSITRNSFQFKFDEDLPETYTLKFPIDGAYLDLGINTISIKFEKGNYTSSYFSFQLFITAETVNISLYSSESSNEILSNSLIQVTYYDEFSLSLRAMANAEKIYLEGGSATLVIGTYNQEFTENGDFWYNITVTCDPENFVFGINTVYVSFTHPNYTTSNFYFQILVNQIEMNAKTIGFQDSIEKYSGDKLLVRINLTELITNHTIENATIRYSWEFGLGNFDYVGAGIYETTLNLPQNIRGSYKVTVIISTEDILYKAIQTSFFVVISPHELPNYLLWIIIAGAAIAIGVLGALSIRSYVILPRRRKKEAELLSKTQNFKDLQNIQAIVLMHRYSGVPLYSKSYSILEKQKKELFAGFVQAITSIGEEIAGRRSSEEEAQASKVQNLFELDFKYFHCVICDRDDLRIVVVLTEKASENLKNEIINLAAGITLNLNNLIEHWDGALDTFDNNIPPILRQYLDLYYKEPFVLNSVEYISELRKEVELTKMEVRVLNTVYSMAKSKKSFFLDYIIETVHEENKDIIIEAIESLISNKVFLPTSK